MTYFCKCSSFDVIVELLHILVNLVIGHDTLLSFGCLTDTVRFACLYFFLFFFFATIRSE